MRKAGATLAVAVLITALARSPASASSAIVTVRVEGKAQTLFEGPIRTEGHNVEAASDTQMRLCDGTNGGAHATPGPTPTTAAVDAMTIAGQTFDGTWSAGFDDYFITRWGPDKQSAAESEYWGLLVNQAFTAKGGCQYELAEGDEVLWVYNAFSGRPFLTLAAGSDSSTPPSPTAIATLGQPFAVRVSGYTSTEGTHHDLGPHGGAEVSPVSTAANGFESVDTASPPTVTTAADGIAAVTFMTPGWHRLKALATGAIRSNRLDVCVPAEGAADCGALPPDDQVRGLATVEPPGEPSARETTSNPEAKTPGAATAGSGAAGGAGVLGDSRSWQVKELRLRGLVLRPTDDRAGGLVYAGHWRRATESGAWLGTLSLGIGAATLTFRLAAGRPVLIVRHVRHDARIAITVGGRRQVFTIRGSRARTSRIIIGARRVHGGSVQVRVLKGTVGVDAVALAS